MKMRTVQLLENLVTAVKKKLPPEANLATSLSEILYMGKEAVYRRLRGEVPFTFAEAALISERLNVSLDNTVGITFTGNSVFYLNHADHEDPLQGEAELFERSVEDLRRICSEPYSEVGSSSNMLPQAFLLGYENISKFRTYKRMYQNSKPDEIKPYKELVIPDSFKRLQQEFVDESKNIKYTFYVWDSMIFSNIVKDVEYFLGVQLISREEAEKIKQELYLLINELEILAAKGKFDNGNKIDLYISSTHFDTTYSYVESSSLHFSLIRVFTTNSIASQDKKIFDSLKDWIQSLKRISMLISESGEMQRVLFFRQQREIVNFLKI